MKIFGWIVLINILIYTGYMLIMNVVKEDILAAAIILFHSLGLIAISSFFKGEGEVKEWKQAFITSGLIILLVGMPVCFFWGAGGM